MTFQNNAPVVGQNVFVAPSASVIGRVTLSENSSVWYNAVLRGDVNEIKIGANSNIQDRVIIHCSSGVGGDGVARATIIGDYVTVESGAILHACTLQNESYVGLGATVLDGAIVESHSMIAPGSVVAPHTVVPAGQLWAGIPAKMVRNLTEAEQATIAKMAHNTFLLSNEHRVENDKQVNELLHEIETTKFKEDRLYEYDYHNPQLNAQPSTPNYKPE